MIKVSFTLGTTNMGYHHQTLLICLICHHLCVSDIINMGHHHQCTSDTINMRHHTISTHQHNHPLNTSTQSPSQHINTPHQHSLYHQHIFYPSNTPSIQRLFHPTNIISRITFMSPHQHTVYLSNTPHQHTV